MNKDKRIARAKKRFFDICLQSYRTERNLSEKVRPVVKRLRSDGVTEHELIDIRTKAFYEVYPEALSDQYFDDRAKEISNG